MIKDVRTLRTLADESRLRLLRLLKEKELFVCQLMAVTGLSQPLVSRSLALLEREELIDSRRQGKHVFYRLKKIVPPLGRAVIVALDSRRDEDDCFARDRRNLALFCRRFQRGGACDMGTVREFVAFRNKNQKKEP
jgi:DNA-binding transcriptional ArsR family regulator